MNSSKLKFVIGSLFILTGLFVPSSTLIEFLRGTPPVDLLGKLLLGATLFKIGLAILGLLVILLNRASVLKSGIRKERYLSDKHKRLTLVVLGVILFAAALLRLYALNLGLWYDEIWTYVNYARMPFGEIITTYDSQNQHTLFTLLAHLSFQIFGESAWALRLPAVLFGVGSIWALYLLGCQVGTGREALFSASILTFSYHHIWFSQNARGYTGLLFWTILSSWLLLRSLHEERPQLWLLYAISAALGIYTHMTMLFVVVGHFLIYLMMLIARRKEIWPDRWAGFFLGFCLMGFLTLQLYALVLPQILGSVAGHGGAVTVWRSPFWTLFEFVKGLKVGFVGGFSAVAAVAIFIMGLWDFVRKNPIVVQLLLFPVVIGATVVIGMGHHIWPRFFFFSMGFGVLIVVRGAILFGNMVGRLLNFESQRLALAGTILCMGLILVSAVSALSAYGPKQDYLGALTFIEERREPGDTVVAVGMSTVPYKQFYQTDWVVVETIEALNNIRFSSKRIWLLYTMPIHMQSFYPDIMESILRDFKVIERFYGTLGDGTIFVCRADLIPT